MKIRIAEILMTLGIIGMLVALFLLVDWKWAILWTSTAAFIGGCVAERINGMENK